MSRDPMVRYQGKSTQGQLQRLQHFHAFGMHFRRRFTCLTHQLHKFGNHIGGRERRSLQPHAQGSLEGARHLKGHVQTNDQLVGAKFMPRNSSYGTLRLCTLNCCCGHGGDQSPLVAAHYPFSDSSAKLWNLCISSIQYGRYGICSPQEGALVRVKCVPVLPTHYEYCDCQSGDRSDCLNPSRPVGLREFVVVSQDDDIDNAKNYQKCDREVGIFHALAARCLKGILA